MTTSRILVTVAGAAAIVWVLWYFLALPGRSGADRGVPKS